VNLRQLWTSVQRWYATHPQRDRRILAGVAAAIVLSIVYLGVVRPIIDYRHRVTEEIADGQEQLERSARFVAAADQVRAERDELHQRLEQAKKRLLPGSSGTLGAAALQERANAIAAEKGITVQSTQVMKEEPADPFRKVSIRLTLSGELKPFADLLAGLEYGEQQLTIPFLEVSRRGAVAGAKGPRTLSGTVEVSGYLLGETAKNEPAEGEAETPPPAAEGETPPAEGAEATPPAAGQPAPEGTAEVPPATPPAPPPAGANQPPATEAPHAAAEPPSPPAGTPPAAATPPAAPTPPAGATPPAAAAPPATPPPAAAPPPAANPPTLTAPPAVPPSLTAPPPTTPPAATAPPPPAPTPSGAT
jgi:type II secretory pathway component PulM